jgi:deoxyhypusine synthase
MDAKPVKVSCDATIVFPLIVSQTFLKVHAAEVRAKTAAAVTAAAATKETKKMPR